MFDNLSEKLGGILDKLTRRGALREADVDEAMREVRRALLEADVALDVAREFVDNVRKQAVGVEVLKSVTPGQMVVKIVHDQLVATLGAEAQAIDLHAAPPVAIMMVGLQGSGKTTTTAKLAKRLTERQKKKVLMASLDVRRPAAMEQLAVNDFLAKQNVKPAGPFLTIYTETDDTGFSFQAAATIAQPLANPPKGDIAMDKGPSGKALKFVHRGSYDSMDATYEAITNFLDDRQLEAKDLFIEEYASDPVKSDPNNLVVNIYVPVK